MRAGVGREAAGSASVGSMSTMAADEEVPESMLQLEETLLGFEFPPTLKPVLGSAAWSNFQAAVGQMLLIAVLGGLGTFLEQGEPASFYAKAYPELSGIILALGFDKIYGSPIFLGILVWLGASIIACTGTTQIPMARKAQKLQFKSATSLNRSKLIRMKVAAPAVDASADAELGEAAKAAASAGASRRICGLKAALERRGFITRLDNEENPQQLVAQRGLIGKFAPMVVHVGLLLTLIGGAVGIAIGSSSDVMLGDGGDANFGYVLDKGRRAKGPFWDAFSFNHGLMENSQVRVDDFRIEYREDGAIEQYYSKLAVVDKTTKEEQFKQEIYVNQPLRYGGATIYQADWGIDRLQMYVNDVPIVVPMKFLPDRAANDRGWGAFIPQELLKVKGQDASGLKEGDRGGMVLVCENMRNVQVYSGTDGTLQGVLRSPLAKVQEKMEGMPIQFGQSINVEGGVKLGLDRIVGATGLILKLDPGVPLVYLGFFLLMPATLLSVQPFGQVWAAVDKDGSDAVVIGGRANRNQPAFEDELKSVVVSGAL